ncbi:hypothetical protein EDB89DRAFT_960953 [Lactarius sanguifluus]|nr:hypothetical protein EDB89DRAFT_960953 [Lactarius sanguifluus]
MHHRLDAIDVRMDVLQHSIETSQPFPYRQPHQNLLHPLNRRLAFPSDNPPNTLNPALASGLLLSLRSSTGLSPSPWVHSRGSLSRIRESAIRSLLPFAVLLFAYSRTVPHFLLLALRSLHFTTALDCLDELETLIGNTKAETAAALSELVKALNDLGLHEYASSVSGFALEFLVTCTLLCPIMHLHRRRP